TITITPTFTETPLPTFTGSPPPTQVKELFGGANPVYFGGDGNLPTERDLTAGNGVAVTNNPTTPQMIVLDLKRILFWNNPAQLTTGKPADGVIQATFPAGDQNLPDTYLAIKATQRYLYVSEVGVDYHINIYALPLTAGSKPIQDPSPLRFPFYTVDGVSLTTGKQRDVNDDGERGPMWGLAPSSDDRYLWISDQENNRV